MEKGTHSKLERLFWDKLSNGERRLALRIPLIFLKIKKVMKSKPELPCGEITSAQGFERIHP